MAEKATEESGGTREPEEIEQEIGQTREELGETVAALTEKADVKKQAKAKASAAKKKATATKEQIASKAKEVTPESAASGMQQAQQVARENRVPVIVGLAAFGGFVLGWAIGRR